LIRKNNKRKRSPKLAIFLFFNNQKRGAVWNLEEKEKEVSKSESIVPFASVLRIVKGMIIVGWR